MSEWTVITYGAGEILSTTFNAIAALINSKSGTLYEPLVRFGLILGLLWTVAQMVYGDRAKFLNNWMVPFYLALTLFFAPTCRVHIVDPVTHYRFTVDNVPWGLGVVAGTISQIGDTVTREIEKTFSLPDDLQYHKTGAVMASNLIASAKTFQITNTDLAETMRSFMTQCVVYDALLGNKYTMDDLRSTPDIWRLVTENPSPARCFVYKEPGRGKTSEIVTCQDGVHRLKKLLNADMNSAFSKFNHSIFGAPSEKMAPSDNLSQMQLKQYLPIAFNYMTGMAKSAEEHMMQQMMMYALVDGIESKATELGGAPNFAVRKAYLQQRAHGETVAGVAAQKLIAMKNVIEALIYTAFIFILPMALLPLGWKFISRWVGLVMWIQLWAPLYAILNFIMNLSLRSKGIGLITSAGGITLANSLGFMNLHADMAAQTGMLSIAVGSLAYALVKGGAAGFASLSSQLSGPTMSAAGQAADSMLSGNYSFGNVSSGVTQASNASFGQQSWSPAYNSGAFSQNDGTTSRTTTGSGEHVVGISNSNLRSNLQLSEGLSQNYTEQATKAHQTYENKMIAAAQAQAEHNRHVMDLSEHQAKQSSSSETHSTGTQTSANQSFQTLDTLVDRFAKDHSISKEHATQLMAHASASISTGFGFKLFDVVGMTTQLNAGGTAQWSKNQTDKDLLSAATDYSKQKNFQEALSHATQASHDLRTSETSDEGRRYVTSLNSASERSHQMREEASASLQQSQSYSQMAFWTKQHAGNINANLNQEYVNWLQTQSLPNSRGAMGITEAETILSSRPELDHAYQQKFLEGKMRQMESQFGELGLPRSAESIGSAFRRSEERIQTYPSQGSVSNAASEHAHQSGFGENFSLNTRSRNDAKEQLNLIADQLTEQRELIEKSGLLRKKEVIE